MALRRQHESQRQRVDDGLGALRHKLQVALGDAPAAR